MPSRRPVRPPLTAPTVRERSRTEISDEEARSVRATVNATDPGSKSPGLSVDGSTSRQVNQKGIVKRLGRPRADGQRVGEGEAAKVTYYVPPDVAAMIAMIAFRLGKTKSEVAAEALAAYVTADANQKTG